MTPTLKTDILVIGAGSAGLSVAAGASQMGADTVLIERGKMGGDCLNYGCVPSKAMLAAGQLAADARRSESFGIIAEPQINFARVQDHVSQVIAAIAPNDSVERFEGFGVKVIREAARFVGPRRVQAGDAVISARRIVIATGSSPMVPPIPGLDQTPFLTNETVFANRTLPRHLIVIGGGPIGMELAQAHRRLGARVTVLEGQRALGKDDPELTAMVLDRLRKEGIDIHENAGVSRVDPDGDGGVRVTIEQNGNKTTLTGSHLLVATGRKANVDSLDLEAGGIEYTPKGIKVDQRLRTSDKKVFAIGDVAGGLQFTHVASYHAGIVIRNALFHLPAKVDYKAVPWVTYTDPELAHVGLTEAQARDQHGNIEVLRWSLEENDRAQAERATEGLIKVVIDRKSRIVGATLAGRHAGELIHPWVLAVGEGMKIKTLASYIAPYPTLGEIGKRAAGSFYSPKLFSDKTRRVVRLLRWLG